MDKCYNLLFNYAKQLAIIDEVPDFESSKSPTTSAARLMKSFREYRDDKSAFTSPMYKYMEGVDGHPKRWWEQFLHVEEHHQLAEICVRLFSLCSSSAAVERAFSAMNWIHSIKRNSLHETAVEMLMAIILDDRFENRPEHHSMSVPDVDDDSEEDSEYETDSDSVILIAEEDRQEVTLHDAAFDEEMAII